MPSIGHPDRKDNLRIDAAVAGVPEKVLEVGVGFSVAQGVDILAHFVEAREEGRVKVGISVHRWLMRSKSL